jgi:hypothetical protein
MSNFTETAEDKAERLAGQSLQKEGTFQVELEYAKEGEDKNGVPNVQLRYLITEGEDSGKGFTDTLTFYDVEQAKYDDAARVKRYIALGIKDDFEAAFNATITNIKVWNALSGKPFVVDRVATVSKTNGKTYYNTKNIRKAS